MDQPGNEQETGKVRKQIEGEDCPVCFEAMLLAEERAGRLVFCCGCGNNFHADCIRRWQQASGPSSRGQDCPLCRQPWHEPKAHVQLGGCIPAFPRELSFGSGYLNLGTPRVS
mmetsp:Transcript_28297/g.65680  ORF Transcript_28297/g.65680 Transcript_28297/m.65680 type:complete len:113 (+) Transcript_28297:845-1183(+)